MNISEITITPVKNDGKGLIGFASCVVDDSIYLSSIGILTKLSGGYRILYPTKKLGDKQLHYFHPINKQTSSQIEGAILNQCNNLFQ